MSDTPDQVESPEPTVPAVSSNTIRDSQFYQMIHDLDILAPMKPAFENTVATELELERSYPREPSDEGHTRILVVYRNRRKNSLPFKLTDNQRLDRKFTIDHFIGGFTQAMKEGGPLPNDPKEEIFVVLLGAVGSALTTALGMNPEQDTAHAKSVAEQFACAAISCIFDDPEDMFVSIDEMPMMLDPDVTQPTITAIWCTKKRKPGAVDPVTLTMDVDSSETD